MKARLAGLILFTGMSLAANAENYKFTPVTSPGNSVLQSLGNQLNMEVRDGGADNVLFTFTNNGTIESSISRVYFDDNPSNLFASFAVNSESPGVDYAMNADPPNLTGARSAPLFFFATDSAAALRPRYNNGVNHSAEVPGEQLTMSGILNAGRSFTDVIASLNGGDPSIGNFLRVGLRVIGIDQFNDSGSASFLDTGTSGPAPIPESSIYGMLLAGLGLITAIARRRHSPH